MKIASYIENDHLKLSLFGNGVILQPGSLKTGHNQRSLESNIVFEQPFNIYLITANLINIKISKDCSEYCGFDSIDEALGRSSLKFVKSKYRDKIIENNNYTINKKPLLVEENVILTNGIVFSGLSVKVPWYDENGNVLGFFGCSAAYGRHEIPLFLQFVANLGLFSNLLLDTPFYTPLRVAKDGAYLTRRENQILQFVKRGMTAKQIAEMIHLSYRTVEHHIERIKMKMNVNFKTDLLHLS